MPPGVPLITEGLYLMASCPVNSRADHEFWTALGETFELDIVAFESKLFPSVNDITIWRGRKKAGALEGTTPAVAECAQVNHE